MKNTKSVNKQRTVPDVSALSLIFSNLRASDNILALAKNPNVTVEDVGAEQCRQIGRQMVQNILSGNTGKDEPNASANDLASIFMLEKDGQYDFDQKKVDACTEMLCDQAVEFITGYMKGFPREMLSVKDLDRRVREVIDSGGLISTGPGANDEEESYVISYESHGEVETKKWSGRGRHGKVIGDILRLGEFADWEGNPKDLIKERGEVSGFDDQYGHWSVKQVSRQHHS